MSYAQAILSDPIVQMAVAVLAIALVLAIARIPKSAVSRKRVLWALWLLSFAGLSQWVMWLQSAVLTAGHLPSTYDTVTVPIKGTVRYVPQDLAYRHDAAMFVLLGCMVAFMLVLNIARVADEA